MANYKESNDWDIHNIKVGKVPEIRPGRSGPMTSTERMFWKVVADQLRSNPGEWVYVGRLSVGYRDKIQSDMLPYIPLAKSLEVSGRNHSKKGTHPLTCDFYLRYTLLEDDDDDDDERTR